MSGQDALLCVLVLLAGMYLAYECGRSQGKFDAAFEQLKIKVEENER